MAGYHRRRPPPGPSRRLPYGHRPGSCDVLGEDPRYSVHRAWEFPDARDVPMPRGRGVRWLVRCPRCHVWRKELCSYPRCGFYWCRRCWGLRYPSEYQLRRPEAGGLWDTSRLEALLDRAFRARSPAVGERRLARFAAAMATRDRRELAYVRRFVASDNRLFDAWARTREDLDSPDDP